MPTVLISLAVAVLAATPHPLDPLSADEITAAAEVVRAAKEFPAGALFPVVALAEPAKKDILAYKPGSALPRQALVVVLDRAHNGTFEALVDLPHRKLVRFDRRDGVQPLVLLEEYDTVPKIVRADPRWQEAVRKRGVTRFEDVWVETWAVGTQIPVGAEQARLMRAIFFWQQGAVNFYDRPIEGLTAVVDLNAGKVIELVDSGVVPIAKEHTELDEKSLGPSRAVAKLAGVQPDGPGFTVDGQLVRWQGWSFRFSLHPREGLVLHQVAYAAAPEAKPRSVLYRGSLSEMVVPYGDPSQVWAWRNAFDEGEYGVGRLASPLEAGIDVPATARLFDVAFADDFGKAYTLGRAVALYERDGGLAWKHYDLYHDKNEARRARDLVLSFVATVGNYDYSVAWVFHQDGRLEVECELSGIMLAKGVADLPLGAKGAAAALRPGLDPTHASLVAPHIAAPFHQHFFNFRLDLDVDGSANTVSELDTHGDAIGGANPYGNTLTLAETVLAHEKAAGRDMKMEAARVWRVGNPGVTTALGLHPSYLLVPGHNSMPYADPAAAVRQRAGFVDHHLWVTRQKDTERHAAGWYPNQSRGGEGLLAYVADDEPLTQQDVVVWYTMGLTHITRPEEWPIMNVHRLSFELVPAGFFDRNPALDLPRSPY